MSDSDTQSGRQTRHGGHSSQYLKAPDVMFAYVGLVDVTQRPEDQFGATDGEQQTAARRKYHAAVAPRHGRLDHHLRDDFAKSCCL